MERDQRSGVQTRGVCVCVSVCTCVCACVRAWERERGSNFLNKLNNKLDCWKNKSQQFCDTEMFRKAKFNKIYK